MPAEGLPQNRHEVVTARPAKPLGVALIRSWDDDEMDGLRKLIKWTAIALAVTAIIEQLRRPAEERTWEGTVVGFVPYDFRMPTIERARSRWWNPDEPRLFVPQVFGVGWTINVARLVGLVPDLAGEGTS
jgi:Family of unknown function (DUF5808)